MLSAVGSLAVLGLSAAAEPATGASVEAALYGNYRISDQHQLGIDRFTTDDGKDAVLISDYSTGVVRRLFPVTQVRFVMGPGFNTATPAELTLTFAKDDRGLVRGVWLRDVRGIERFARRVPVRSEAVSFQNTDAKLNGTLLIPSTKGPHPAIVLLHGSGPLTRYSFGLIRIEGVLHRNAGRCIDTSAAGAAAKLASHASAAGVEQAIDFPPGTGRGDSSQGSTRGSIRAIKLSNVQAAGAG